jgi:hypothetical protein
MGNSTKWGPCLALVLSLSSLPAAAQYTYNTRIDCKDAPVSGFKFRDCWISNTYQNGMNLYQSWRLAFSDNLSDVVVGYFKTLNQGYYTVAHPDAIVDMFRTSSAISGTVGRIVNVGNVVSVGSDRYFAFSRSERPDQRCQAFIRYGPLQNLGSRYRVVGFFCRVAREDLSVEEARFLTDDLQFR